MYHPFLCLWDQLHCIFSRRPTFFPSFCLADVPVETFLVALHIPHQIQIQTGFLTPSLQVRDSSCVTRPCFNLLYTSFLCLEFSQELLALPCRSTATFALYPAHWDGLFLSSEELIPENQPAILNLSSLQDCLPWDPWKQIPEQTKVCPLQVQGCDSAFWGFSLLFRILIFTVSWLLQSSLPPTFTSLTSSCPCP